MSDLSITLVSSVPGCGILNCPLGLPLVQPSFGDVFEAIRAKPPCCRAAILGAIHLAEVEESTQAALKSIAERLDDPKHIRTWNLDATNEGILRKQPADPLGNVPDSFFYYHGTTKSRIVYRLAPKEAKSRISSMDTMLRHHVIKIYDSMAVHYEIDGYLKRFEERTHSSLEERQKEIGAIQIAISNKRKSETPHEETLNQRRRLTSDDINDQYSALSPVVSSHQPDFEAPNTSLCYQGLQQNPQQLPQQQPLQPLEQNNEMMVLLAESNWFVDEEFRIQEDTSERDGLTDVG